MKNVLRTAASLFAVLLFTASLFAQGTPRNGACFYRDTAYRGNSFCANSGDSLDNLPSGFNDSIRSVRIFGNAQVRAFNDNRFNGASTTISSDVPDLHMLQLSTDRSRNWSERISSLQVIGGGYGGDRDRDRDRDRDHDRDQDRDRDRDGNPQWGNGAMPGGGGACFFDQPKFRGRSFCASLGQSFNNLPSGFNDRIQSIQVRGNAEVLIFNDNNFGGVAARTRRDVANLASWRIPDDPSRNWGGRISSIRVDAPGRGHWNNNGGYGSGDRDHDRDDDRDRQQPDNGNLIRCNSRQGDRQQFCDTRGNIRDADLVNSYGTCRKYENWGVANGRLWVADGCSGEFQIRR